MKKILPILLMSLFIIGCTTTANFSEDNIRKIVSKNENLKEYLETYPNTKITITALTKEEIEYNQNNPVDYKELYTNLGQEDNRYAIVRLSNDEDNKGFISSVDAKTEEVVFYAQILHYKLNLSNE